MAKQIKAIKCPHCGSVDKTKLDKDLYHCENCNTDYFLDNDDINININNKVRQESKPFDFLNTSQNKVFAIVLGAIIALAVILIMINTIISKPAPRQYGTYSSSSPTKTITTTPPKPTKPPVVEDKPIKYLQHYKIYYSYINDANQIYSFSIAYRSYDSKQKELNGNYYEIRDVATGKIINSKLLQQDREDDNWYFRRFDNGTAYVVYNDSIVYAFNEQNLNVTDVTQTLIKNRPEFVSGIATINLTPWGYEDSFYILTNNGQEYFYYPLLGKVYNYNTDYDELRKYFRLLDDKRETADKMYTRTSYDFEYLNGRNSNATLIKVVYNTKNISEYKKFGFSSVSKGDKPYKINFQSSKDQLIEDKVLAKDRVFFEPTIIYSSKDQLIIRVKNNASPNAYFNLQSLDTNTGEVKWTIKGDQSLDFSDLHLWSKHNLDFNRILIPHNDKYVVQLGYGHYILISATGKTEQIITYDPEEVFEKDVK